MKNYEEEALAEPVPEGKPLEAGKPWERDDEESPAESEVDSDDADSDGGESDALSSALTDDTPKVRVFRLDKYSDLTNDVTKRCKEKVIRSELAKKMTEELSDQQRGLKDREGNELNEKTQWHGLTMELKEVVRKLHVVKTFKVQASTPEERKALYQSVWVLAVLGTDDQYHDIHFPVGSKGSCWPNGDVTSFEKGETKSPRGRKKVAYRLIISAEGGTPEKYKSACDDQWQLRSDEEVNGVGRFLTRALFKSRNRERVYKCSPGLSRTIGRFQDAFGKADTARMKKKDFSKTKGEPQPLLEQNIEEAEIAIEDLSGQLRAELKQECEDLEFQKGSGLMALLKPKDERRVPKAVERLMDEMSVDSNMQEEMCSQSMRFWLDSGE